MSGIKESTKYVCGGGGNTFVCFTTRFAAKGQYAVNSATLGATIRQQCEWCFPGILQSGNLVFNFA